MPEGQELREVFTEHLFVHLSWNNKWPDVRLYTNSHAVVNGQARCQGFGRNMIGKLVTRYLGKDYVDRLFHMGEGCKKCLYAMQMYV